MSIHTIPPNIDIELAYVLLIRYLRRPDGIVYGNGDNQPPTAIEFVPDLTPTEQNILSALAIRLTAFTDLDNVPNWATYSGQQAQDAVHTAVFNGQDAATIKANIASQLTNITTANVAQINARLDVIRTLLGNAVDAIIAIRGILENIGKLLAYIRDIALR